MIIRSGRCGIDYGIWNLKEFVVDFSLLQTLYQLILNPDLKTRGFSLWSFARVPRCHCPWVCEERWPWFWDDAISESPQPALPGLPPRVLGEVRRTGRQKTRRNYACERPSWERVTKDGNLLLRNSISGDELSQNKESATKQSSAYLATKHTRYAGSPAAPGLRLLCQKEARMW